MSRVIVIMARLYFYMTRLICCPVRGFNYV